MASRSGLIVPTASSTEVEQVDHGSGVALALWRAGLLLEPERRLVQELGDDAARERVDGVTFGVVELDQPAT